MWEKHPTPPLPLPSHDQVLAFLTGAALQQWFCFLGALPFPALKGPAAGMYLPSGPLFLAPATHYSFLTGRNGTGLPHLICVKLYAYLNLRARQGNRPLPSPGQTRKGTNHRGKGVVFFFSISNNNNVGIRNRRTYGDPWFSRCCAC